MTWTKLGDEFLPATADLSDAAFRTHVEALLWSSWRLLDLEVRKRDLRRFASTEDYAAAAEELAAAGWWEDRGDRWYIGLRFPEWQQDRSDVEKRRAKWSAQKQRQRAHRNGDHRLCLPRSCPHADMSTVDTDADTTAESATGPGVGVGVGVGTGEAVRGTEQNAGQDTAWPPARKPGSAA